MFRGCPSGGMFHRFDKLTHRCRCGRWQAGFAPKKEPVKARGECQICERKQATDKDGTLGHHGYKRPGCGWIQGDCMGEGHLPYPATDVLELYLKVVEDYRERCQRSLEHLPEVPSLPYVYDVYVDHRRVQKSIDVYRAGGNPRTVDGKLTSCSVPAFASLEQREIRKLENEICHADSEIERVKTRIENASKQTVSV